MKKIVMFLYFVTALLPASSYGRMWWDMDYDDYTYDYDDSIDYPALKRIIEQEMDHLFEPRKQSVVNRNYINELKTYVKEEICKTVRNACSTHTQAKKMVVQLTEEFAVDMVVEWAAYLAREMLKNPPVNPAYINKPEIIKSVKQVIRSQARMALRENNRRLTQLVQNLAESVEVLIGQELVML